MKFLNDKNWSIRRKLITGFLGLVILAVIIILWSTRNLVENRIREDINTNFQEAGRLFERIQEVRFRQLQQTAILLADYQSLKAAITTGDTATVNQKIREELRYLLDVDPIIPDSLLPRSYISNVDSTGLLMVTDEDGNPLGQMTDSPLPEYSIADRPSIRNALKGNYPSRANIWKKNGRYFNTITVPIWLKNQLLGTLTYGFPIRQVEAEQLARDFENEVSYYVDNRLLATSFIDEDKEFRERLTKKIHASTFEVGKRQGAFVTRVAGQQETYMVYVAPMQNPTRNTVGIEGYFVIAKSLTQALEPLNRLLFIVLLIGLVAIAVAVLISVWITGRLTYPIQLLSSGIQRLEQGDYNQKVPVVTNDELGQLTRTFNNLVSSLRERLMMLKFVSEATQDAIKTNPDATDVNLGGERRDVCVFFSDIRGFTKWSETRNPEAVIDMLNSILRFQTEIVQKHGGDVDKFVGDELVAIFRGYEKEQNAVLAAIEIQQRIKELFDELKGEIAVGIGVNTGEVLMGAVGSEKRMDYTVLGTTVNLGSRLCSTASPHQILISNAVYELMERRIPIQELQPIAVKGFSEPITIFEVDWQSVDPEAVEHHTES